MSRLFTPQLRLPASLLTVATLMLSGGCSSSTPKKVPFDELRLGMSADEATKLIGRPGKPYDHDKLPYIPLPRVGYQGIPESTTYFVWWDEVTGEPALTVGMLEGRVIYKQVMWNENGQAKGESVTLPEYQGSNQSPAR